MKRPFNKKRFWLIVAILALVEAAILCLALQWKYIFPSKEVSELYTRYENVDGVDVSFIKDYKVNDTVFVDVTLLEAIDSMGWATLKKDFEIPNPSPDFQQRIDIGKDLIYTKKIPKVTVADSLKKSHPNVSLLSREDDSLHSSQGAENVTYGNDLLAISYLNHTLTIFHIKNDVENRAIIYHNFDKSTNQ